MHLAKEAYLGVDIVGICKADALLWRGRWGSYPISMTLRWRLSLIPNVAEIVSIVFIPKTS